MRLFYFKKSALILLITLSIPLLFSSCSLAGLTNPDNYSRNHEVYAVDFNPHNLNQLKISKMDEGKWVDYEEVKNGKSKRFTLDVSGEYLTVTSHKNKMEVPTYQTWLDYAREHLGYTVEDEYDIFTTIEEGWIYEIDLAKHPLIETENHRILMYELK